MAKPEWGVKRICPSCSTRYYDLRKDPPVCPSCGTQFDPEALLKSRRARPVPADDVVKKSPVVTEDEDVETGLDEDEDDVLIEDTSELGEDDMDEVVDVEGEDEEER